MMSSHPIDFLYQLLIEPFVAYEFMSRALVSCFAIAITSGPLGVILVLRRLSLIGDALSHSILPGIAIGYIGFGLSVSAMSFFGVLAGLLIAVLAGIYAKRTHLNEDATLSGFYLFSLALGVMLLSTGHGNMKLTHLLFGNVLAITEDAMSLILILSAITLIVLLIFYRVMMYSYFDPTFMGMMGINTKRYNFLFLILVVLNLVAACQSLGTLMALGIMMLPAITANLLTRSLPKLFLLSSGIAFIASYTGLIFSFFFNLPTGPVIILICGSLYILALLTYSLFPRNRHYA